MVKNSFFIFFLIVLFACESRVVENNSLDNNLKPKKDVDSILSVSEMNLSFESFISKINKDCKYQIEHVKYPLQMISLTDFENQIYDTTYIVKKEFECMEFTSPKSNIIEGIINLKTIHRSEFDKIIQLGVEDTGIHIQYFFTFEKNNWHLVKILDEST